MGFTGFPSETYAEAIDSVDVLEDLREHWTFGGLGKFSLTAGAIVAKAPKDFGVTSVTTRPQDDIHLLLDFEEAEPPKTADEMAEVERRCARLVHPLQLDRPFVGGIDTPHTFFYLERYGLGTKAQLETGLGVETGDALARLEGVVLSAPPAVVWPFLAEGTKEAIADSRSCLLATADGRLVRCPRFVATLAPWLDGRLSVAELTTLATTELGISPSGCALALGFLQQSKFLRFVSPSRRGPESRPSAIAHPDGATP